MRNVNAIISQYPRCTKNEMMWRQRNRAAASTIIMKLWMNFFIYSLLSSFVVFVPFCASTSVINGNAINMPIHNIQADQGIKGKQYEERLYKVLVSYRCINQDFFQMYKCGNR